MSNCHIHNFPGRIAKAPVLTHGADNVAVCKFTLMRNDYAGKDDAGKAKEKVLSIQCTAFRSQAEAIAKHCHKGDQLIVDLRIENNNWKDKEGVDHYDYNFIVDDFEFGAPGEEKRALLAKREPTTA